MAQNGEVPQFTSYLKVYVKSNPTPEETKILTVFESRMKEYTIRTGNKTMMPRVSRVCEAPQKCLSSILLAPPSDRRGPINSSREVTFSNDPNVLLTLCAPPFVPHTLPVLDTEWRPYPSLNSKVVSDNWIFRQNVLIWFTQGPKAISNFSKERISEIYTTLETTFREDRAKVCRDRFQGALQDVVGRMQDIGKSRSPIRTISSVSSSANPAAAEPRQLIPMDCKVQVPVGKVYAVSESEMKSVVVDIPMEFVTL